MPEQIYFIAGLPRSGSTLLCNILCQNPEFLATSTSGIAEVLRGIKDGWANVAPFRAQEEQEMYSKLRQTLRATLFGYYEDVEQRIVFDKSRAWLAYIEMLEEILNYPIKILVTVRNLADVMASWEMRYRETMALSSVPVPKDVPVATIEDRVKWYAAANHPIGHSYNLIKDAIARDHKDYMHFVDFDALTHTPKSTMVGIYEFLGIDWFPHDFENVEQVTQEDDREHGFISLHKIRTKIEPVPSRWREVLGSQGENISKQRCW